MKIAWIGVGKLGHPMAGHAGAAHDLTVFDTVEANAAAFPSRAQSVTDAVRDAAVVFSTIPNDAVLRAVAAEARPAMASDAVFVDMSTVSPGASEEVAAMEGGPYLRAPVSGSVSHAEKGILTTLCSGPREAFERVRPIFESFSTNVYHVGEAEEARYLKLVINNMVGATSALLAESLTLGRKGGLDWKTMLDVINDSAVASPLVKYKVGPLTERDFAPAFTTTQMIKDVSLVVDAAQAVGTQTPLAEKTLAMMRETAEAGMGEEDFVATVKLLEGRAGLSDP